MDYKNLKIFIYGLNKNAKILNLGSSVLGRTLFGVWFNLGAKDNIIIHASIHAREHITTDLVCYLMEMANRNYGKLFGKIPNILFIPMVNPDGVELCYYGLKSAKFNDKKQFLQKINGGDDFTLFKANANGVDLNNNFNADFGADPRYKTEPASHGYAGTCFESEPESKMLVRVTQIIKPVFTISYHCKGEEIYYNYKLSENKLKYHKKIANYFAKILKYNLVDNTGLSCGGFKDYCISKLKIPSLTIEVGRDKYSHPLPNEALYDIIKKHKNFYNALSKSYKFIKLNRNKF